MAPRSRMKKKMKTQTLRKNHTSGITQAMLSGSPKVGPAGPPKNRVTTMADMVTTDMNSASMNIPNRMPEYSVLNPPTSSPSASARSKGGRPASATIPMTNTRNAGNNGMTYQAGIPSMKPGPDWADTMSETRRLPV